MDGNRLHICVRSHSPSDLSESAVIPSVEATPQMSQVKGTFGYGMRMAPGQEIPEPSGSKKKAPRKENVETDSSGNWVPLDEYYYGKKEGDPGYTEEKEEYRFKCWYCSKMLYNNVRTMQHIQGHIDSGKQQNIDLSDLTQCKQCYKQFDTPFEMQTHMEKVHLSNQVLMCRICEKDQECPRDLTIHMRTSHVACEMPYVCQLCNFRSSMYSDVVDHFKKKHDSSQHLLCLYCLRAFRVKFVSQGWGQTQTYYGHLLKHQSKSSTKKCVSCRLTFFNSGDVKHHKKNHHMPNHKGVMGIGGSSFSSQDPVMIKVNESGVPEKPKGSKLKSLNAPSIRKVQDIGGIQLPNAVYNLNCFECQMSMGTADHYKKHVNCSMCRFATSCSVAYANHMMGFHSGQMSSMNLNIPWERPLEKPMYCQCGFSTKYGNKIANHLAFCSRGTCYSKPQGSPKSSKENTKPGDADTPKKPEASGSSILNILGLMKKKSLMTPEDSLRMEEPAGKSVDCNKAIVPKDEPAPDVCSKDDDPIDQSDASMSAESSSENNETSDEEWTELRQGSDSKTYKTYTLKDKRKIVELASKNGVQRTAKRFNISKSTIMNWLKIDFDKELTKSGHTSDGGRPSLFGEFEDKIVIWIKKQRSVGIPVTQDQISSYARHIAQTENPESDFKASRNWVSAFMDRHNLRAKKKSDKKTETQGSKKTDTPAFISDHLKGNIFGDRIIVNVDEPVCFYLAPGKQTGVQSMKSISALKQDVSEEKTPSKTVTKDNTAKSLDNAVAVKGDEMSTSDTKTDIVSKKENQRPEATDTKPADIVPGHQTSVTEDKTMEVDRKNDSEKPVVEIKTTTVSKKEKLGSESQTDEKEEILDSEELPEEKEELSEVLAKEEKDLESTVVGSVKKVEEDKMQKASDDTSEEQEVDSSAKNRDQSGLDIPSEEPMAVEGSTDTQSKDSVLKIGQSDASKSDSQSETKAEEDSDELQTIDSISEHDDLDASQESSAVDENAEMNKDMTETVTEEDTAEDLEDISAEEGGEDEEIASVPDDTLEKPAGKGDDSAENKGNDLTASEVKKGEEKGNTSSEHGTEKMENVEIPKSATDAEQAESEKERKPSEPVEADMEQAGVSKVSQQQDESDHKDERLTRGDSHASSYHRDSHRRRESAEQHHHRDNRYSSGSSQYQRDRDRQGHDRHRHGNRSHDYGYERDRSYERDRDYGRDSDRSYERDRDRDRYNQRPGQDYRGQGSGYQGQGYRGHHGNEGDRHRGSYRDQDRNYNRNFQNRGGHQNYRGGYRGRGGGYY